MAAPGNQPELRQLNRNLNLLITTIGEDDAAKAFSKISAQAQLLGRTLSGVTRVSNKFFGSFGAGHVGLSAGVKALNEYNKELLKTRSLFSGDRVGFAQIRRQVKGLSHEFQFSRKSVTEFISTFRSGFIDAGKDISKAGNFMRALTHIVGDNADEVNRLQKSLQGVAEQYIGLQKVLTGGFDSKGNLSGSGKFAASLIGSLGATSTGRVGTAQRRELQALVSGGDSLGTRDYGRKSAEENLKALNSIRQTVEDANIMIGEKLDPVVKNIGRHVQSIDRFLATWGIAAAIGNVVGEVFGSAMALLGARSLGGKLAGGAAGRAAGGAAGGATVAAAAKLSIARRAGLALRAAPGAAARFAPLAGGAALAAGEGAVMAAGYTTHAAIKIRNTRRGMERQSAKLYGGSHSEVARRQNALMIAQSRQASSRYIGQSILNRVGVGSSFLDSSEVKKAKAALAEAQKEAVKINKEFERSGGLQKAQLAHAKRLADIIKSNLTDRQKAVIAMDALLLEEKSLVSVHAKTNTLLQARTSEYQAQIELIKLAGGGGPTGAASGKLVTDIIASAQIAKSSLLATKQVLGKGVSDALGFLGTGSSGAMGKIFGEGTLSSIKGIGDPIKRAEALAKITSSVTKEKMTAKGLNETEQQHMLELRAAAEVILENLAKVSDIRAETLSVGPKIIKTLEQETSQFSKQMDLQTSQLSIAQAQVDLATNLAMGIGPSAEMRMQAAAEISDQIAVSRREIAMVDRQIADAKKMKDIDEITRQGILLNRGTRRNQLEAEILNKNTQQAQMLRQIRDGYISAIGAMTTGSGVFTKILFTQDKNLGTLMRSVGSVPTAIRTGADVGGFGQSERYGPGFIKSNANRRGQAFGTDTPLPMLFGNNLAENAALGMDVLEESMKHVSGEAIAFAANQIASGEITGSIEGTVIKGINNAIRSGKIDVAGLARSYIDHSLGPNSTGRQGISSASMKKMEESIVRQFTEVLTRAMEAVSDKIEEMARVN